MLSEMNKLVKGASAIAMLVMTACAQPAENTDSTALRTIDLYIGAEKAEVLAADGTRISYDESVEANWEVGDEISVYAITSDGQAHLATLTAQEAGRQTGFEGQIAIPVSGSDVTIERIYAYYNGANVNVTPNIAAGELSFSIPTEQNGDHSDHNLGLAVMEGPWNVTTEAQELIINETINFTPFFTRLDVKVANLPQDQAIKYITISLDDYDFATDATVSFDDMENFSSDKFAETAIYLRADAANDLTYGMTSIIPIKFTTTTNLNVEVITASSTDPKAGTSCKVSFKTPNEFAPSTRYSLTVDFGKAATESVTFIDSSNFVDAINSNKGGNFVLTEDMTFDSFPNITDFSGSFDGDGHTIDMSGVGSVSSEQAGIFGNTTGDASVSNVTVNAGDLDGNAGEGGLIVGKVTAGTLTLDNVHGSGNISASRHDDAKHMFGGGLVGFVPAEAAMIATNCSFTGSISIDQSGYYGNVKNSYVGGIVGSVETGGGIVSSGAYNGSDHGTATQIINCKVTNSTLTNKRGSGAITPGATEFYTGGIAGRCTGLIKDCTVENVTISAESAEDGSRRQAKPILGNDWNEHIDNANNHYTNVVINGGEARTGVYDGTRTAKSETPSYSDLK